MSEKKPKKEDSAPLKAKDESNDRIYYTVTPRLVWALSQDPYDLALWIVIKDIAGERGECILSREDLATLSMMSSGQVSISRDRLLSKGLLKGEPRRDPGYFSEVWHLSIPDIWESNVRWARMYSSLRSRIEFKREQKRLAGLEKQSKKKDKAPSLHDEAQSPEGAPSLHDEPLTYSDEPLTYSDAKNNVLEKPKEEINIDELRELFSRAAEIVFQNVKDGRILETVLDELYLASIDLEQETKTFRVSGLPESRVGYYSDRYKRSFENAFIGILGQAVSIEFRNGATPHG